MISREEENNKYLKQNSEMQYIFALLRAEMSLHTILRAC